MKENTLWAFLGIMLFTWLSISSYFKYKSHQLVTVSNNEIEILRANSKDNLNKHLREMRSTLIQIKGSLDE